MGANTREKNFASFDVPPGACDCHVHVFDPDRFPYSPSRRYTPGKASLEDLLALQNSLGLRRVVVVQPSIYGVDHACMLEAIRRLGPRARGIGVIDEAMEPSAIATLDHAGVRGARINLEVVHQRNPADAARRLRTAAKRVPPHWHIQIYTALPVIAALKEEIADLSVPAVIDHFGLARAEGGPGQAGFEDLLALMRSGKAYVKLSAPYLVSKRAPGYDDVAPIARALVKASPDRVLWGSNWPHTGGANRRPDQDPSAIEPFRSEDDRRNLCLLADWVPDAAVRRAILVDNPARVYGFRG
jgi:predicted TIM-barrel fold metal-dependent hydrolase